MLSDVLGIAIILLVYLCILVVVFAPSLYAAWFYVISRRVSVSSRASLKTAVVTFLINLILVTVLFRLGSEYVITHKIAETDALLESTLRNAISSQERFRSVHGRYYPVGPIRGPYQDGNGLAVDKDVILEVVPVWDKALGRQIFEAHAVHVWGQSVFGNTKDGRIEKAPYDSEHSAEIRAKLLRSVK